MINLLLTFIVGMIPYSKVDTPIIEVYPKATPEILEMCNRVDMAEASNEPFDGKVAVISALIDRVLSPDYPNTFEECIDGQFSVQDNENLLKNVRTQSDGHLAILIFSLLICIGLEQNITIILRILIQKLGIITSIQRRNMNKRQTKKVICPHGYYKHEKQFMKSHIILYITVPRIRQRDKWIHKTITSELKKLK